MVMTVWKRLFWLMICIFLIFYVSKCQVTETVWERANLEIIAKQQNYKAEITAAELDDFIRLWPQYKQLKLNSGLVVSYQVEKPSDLLDWKSKVWFVYHRWDADRFFYVQQRIAALLYTLSTQRNAEALLRQLRERKKSSIVKQMIEVQEQRRKSGDGYQSELDLIAARESVLKELFK